MRLWIHLAASILLAVAVLGREAPAQTAGPSQYDVEAVYLFDFAKFVRWPAEAEHETIAICVAGQNTYVDTLKKIVAGERIGTRPFEVRAIQKGEEEAGCNILFLDSSVKEHLDELLTASAGKPALTVSDIPGFLDRGGMIQFVLTGNRVRFSVDLRPVARSGISLSSELLKVAANVNGNPAGGGAL
jgi:hypothetical protein